MLIVSNICSYESFYANIWSMFQVDDEWVQLLYDMEGMADDAEVRPMPWPDSFMHHQTLDAQSSAPRSAESLSDCDILNIKIVYQIYHSKQEEQKRKSKFFFVFRFNVKIDKNPKKEKKRFFSILTFRPELRVRRYKI